jgi:uncharacterized protein (TIGR02001 family)
MLRAGAEAIAMRKFYTAALSLGALLAGASTAQAQDARGWTLSGDLAAVSDYRYRGVSLSERDPAVQGEATLQASNGFYVYGWASSVRGIGDDIELMGALGWSGAIVGETTLDAGIDTYVYPGADDSTLYELYAILSQPVGKFTLTGEFGYFPEQTNLGDADDVYAKASVSAPLPFAETSMNVGLGWEDGAYGDDKVDWSAGFTVPLKPVEFRLSYVGTNVDGVREADDAIVAELHYKFSL